MKSINAHLESPNLECRLFSRADSDLLLKWRNHESVKKYSRNQNHIDNFAHELWVDNYFAARSSSIFMFLLNEVRVGMIRFDIKGIGESEISIVVDPKYSQLGYGTQMLKSGIALAFDELDLAQVSAVIHFENLKSERLFTNCGFVFVERIGDFKHFVLNRTDNISC